MADDGLDPGMVGSGAPRARHVGPGQRRRGRFGGYLGHGVRARSAILSQLGERRCRVRAVSAPVGTRRPARHEAEGGAGGGLGGQHGVLIDRQEAPIEEFAELDAAAGVGAPARARGDLQPARAEADGVVAGDRHRVAAAEDPVEVPRRPPPDGDRGGGGPREAPVVVGDELRQEALGGLERREAAQPEFTGQAVL